MATSGTVGTTVVSVQELIDHGARRAGKLAEELTNEQVFAAKTSLFYVLSNLPNIGIHYWCISKSVLGLYADQYEYALPIGTVDVLNSNYRTVTRITAGMFASSGNASNAYDGNVDTICQQTAPNGYIGVDNGTGNPVYMATVGILAGTTGSFNIDIQYSTDNINWTTLYSPGATTWEDGTWYYYDLDPSVTQSLWRIKETGGGTLAVRELVWGTAPMEIPLARLNRDDYTNLPNKNFTNNRPLQFWFDRTIPQPKMYLWPTPGDYFPQIVAWRHRQIQDVGDLSGELEIPQRWYLAIQNMLAHQMSMELPGVPLERINYCEQQAEKYWAMAEQEERDRSPIYYAPNISYYTR
jgi:hypothetical protein